MSSEIYRVDVHFNPVGKIVLDSQPGTNLYYVRGYRLTTGVCILLASLIFVITFT